ncbi:hypothetical protein PV10_08814 [Exophiala mesophila]|uniref:Uncharacterized protein n=1 Tax=Exophiala mesophila TaxID=212818 RepID=A0A0D1WJZ5_EXOME|nr:uncharacterized protein PV10_08814 [Exophiala mesophila]KIV89230.1 hypothetical protein PV10_08814 [Exophiala mesophila]
MVTNNNTSRLSPPPSRGVAGWLFAIAYLICSVLAFFEIRYAAVKTGLADDIATIVETRRLIDRDVPLRSSWTGIASLDEGISTLVAAFIAGPTGWDKGFQLHMFYFLVSFFPVIAIWTVESVRKGNKGALISFTSLFAIFYQTVGGAIIIPLYYLAYLFNTRKSEYWSSFQRQVPISYSKALLPSLMLGYFIPTLLLFAWPLLDSDPEYKVTQLLIVLWQPTPLLANLLLFLLYKFNSATASPAFSNPKSKTADVPSLATLYKLLYIVALIAHIFTISVVFLSTDPLHSFSHVFVRPQEWGQSGMIKGLHIIFQADYNLIFLSSTIWAFQAVWDLKRTGLARVSLLKAAVLIIVHSLICGPAASLAAVWYWREHKFAEIDDKTA